MTEQPRDKVKARRWVGIWVKDEKFWKDVAANTVAGVLLAGIIYVFGLTAGYFQRPEWVREVVVFVSWLGIASSLTLVGFQTLRLIKGIPDKEDRTLARKALVAGLLAGAWAVYTLISFP